MPPGQTPVIDVTEVVAALTESLGLEDVALSVVGQAESLHQNQLPVGYEVITNIAVIGRVYQQQCRGVGRHFVKLLKEKDLKSDQSKYISCFITSYLDDIGHGVDDIVLDIMNTVSPDLPVRISSAPDLLCSDAGQPDQPDDTGNVKMRY